MVTSNVLETADWIYSMAISKEEYTHTGTHTLLSLSHRRRVLNSLRIATPEKMFSAQEYTVMCKDMH
jgi:hypothetical protein